MMTCTVCRSAAMYLGDMLAMLTEGLSLLKYQQVITQVMKLPLVGSVEEYSIKSASAKPIEM